MDTSCYSNGSSETDLSDADTVFSNVDTHNPLLTGEDPGYLSLVYEPQ
jgi:hypothetical protein